MKRSILVYSFLACFYSFAQIENTPDSMEIQKPVKGADVYSTEAFFLTNWSVTGRTLTENTGLFGDTLGVRADETNLNKWSFGIGFRNRITKNLAWEGGISLLRNGESYSFEGTDTSYNYTTTYTYIGMPLKLDYVIGKKLQFIAAVGVIPQMFMSYRQVGTDVNSEDTETTFDIKTKSGYTPFVLSAVFNLGGQLRLSDQVRFFFIPEYRMQLNSTYTDKSSFIHKGHAIGFNMGLSIGL